MNANIKFTNLPPVSHHVQYLLNKKMIENSSSDGVLSQMKMIFEKSSTIDKKRKEMDHERFHSRH